LALFAIENWERDLKKRALGKPVAFPTEIEDAA
jgi:hypothetical protein